jgi:hypothetical protein
MSYFASWSPVFGIPYAHHEVEIALEVKLKLLSPDAARRDLLVVASSTVDV